MTSDKPSQETDEEKATGRSWIYQWQSEQDTDAIVSEIGKWSTTQIEREKSKAERVYGQLEKQYPNLVPYSEHQSSPPHHMEMELGGILEPAERKIAEKMRVYRQIVELLKVELVERGPEEEADSERPVVETLREGHRSLVDISVAVRTGYGCDCVRNR